MNSLLDALNPYPFARIRALLAGITPNPEKPLIRLSIGEPKHAAPEPVLARLTQSLDGYSQYPATQGSDALRNAIVNWANTRFEVPEGQLSTDQVLPVNGTREALFSVVQALVGAAENALVAMPNPFYQIYEGAAILAGASPLFMNCEPSARFQPDFTALSEAQLTRLQLMYICTPGNPSGSAMCVEQMCQLIELADRYDFVIVSDECYSELYLDERAPVPGLLNACVAMGRDNFARCLVCHSLSKRSNLPGLRSGFMAGDADLISRFLTYRTYHGSAMPLPTQAASQAAWEDETHVVENRQKYREKYQAVVPILAEVFDVSVPDAGFYLWLKTPIISDQFVAQLYEEEHVLVVPGAYLARDTEQGNPGRHYVRLALVDSLESCVSAAQRIRDFMQRRFPQNNPSHPHR